MRNILILACLSLAVVAGGVQLRATLKASEARAATAAEWSGDAAQFVAVGLTNRTLVIAMPDQQDVLGCDALIARAVTNSKIVGEIEAAGFVAIQCGDHRKELTTNRNAKNPVGPTRPRTMFNFRWRQVGNSTALVR